MREEAGELSSVGAIVSTGVVGLFAVIVGVAMWRRYVRELRPRALELEGEQQRLEQDVGDLNSDER